MRTITLIAFVLALSFGCAGAQKCPEPAVEPDTGQAQGAIIDKFVLDALKSPEVKVKGPLPKLMAMLPLLKSVYKKYPEYCKKYGLPLE